MSVCQMSKYYCYLRWESLKKDVVDKIFGCCFPFMSRAQKNRPINHAFENWTFQHAQLFSWRIQQINIHSVPFSMFVRSCFVSIDFSILASNTSHHLTLATVGTWKRKNFYRNNGPYTIRTTVKVYANNGTPVNYLPCIAVSTPFLVLPFLSLSLVPLLLYNSYYVIGNHKQLLSTFLYFHFYDPGMSYTHSTHSRSLTITRTQRDRTPFIHFAASCTFGFCLSPSSPFTVLSVHCVRCFAGKT